MHVTSVAQARTLALRHRLRRAIASKHLREAVMFLAVGGTSTLAYLGLTVALTTLAGLRPSLAILVTLAILMPPTYLAQRRFTFQSQQGHFGAFLRYVGVQLIGNGIGLLGAELFSEEIRGAPWVAFTIIAGVVALVNYGCLKFWAFRQVLR